MNCALKYAAQFLLPSLTMPNIQALKGVVFAHSSRADGEFYCSIP